MAKRAATSEEKKHMGNVAQMPCLVCGARSTVHHVTAKSDRMGRYSRCNKRVVPLCPRHHQIQHGPRESVEALNHQRFFEVYGIDLWAVAEQLWSKGYV